jgi:MFS transporter, SP family, sugar:H+ symporter
MRDMTYTVASVVNVITQFVVAFTVPYLLYAPYANLGPKIGFIFGSFGICTMIFAYLCIPECRRLSLEEIDHLFVVQKTPLRKFKTMKRGEILPEEVLEVGRDNGKGDVSVEHREVSA